MVCAIDQQPLDPPAVPTAQTVSAAPVETDTTAATRKDDSDIVFPEYRWSQRDAWRFLGMSLVFLVVLTVVILAVSGLRQFWAWNLLWNTLYMLICLLTAAYFARTETVASFCKAVGLDRKPTDHIWFGVVAVLVIRFLSITAFNTVQHEPFDPFLGLNGYYFYLLLAAPFLEEPIYRGFLYKAFRGSYPVPLSIALIVGFTAFTHWNQYAHSAIAAVVLSAFTVVLCYLREKSESLWDCILCHFIFNGSSFLLSGLLRY